VAMDRSRPIDTGGWKNRVSIKLSLVARGTARLHLAMLLQRKISRGGAVSAAGITRGFRLGLAV
jgi:hypothetical protein